MTVLVTGDLHLNAKPRDAYRHDFQKTLRTMVRQHRVGAVIILGDLTDEKDWHPAVLVNQVVDHLYRLSLMCPVVFEEGNHDYTSLTETPFFDFVRRIPNVTWIGEPSLGFPTAAVPAPALTRLGRLLWLPHTPDYKRDWKDIPFDDGWDWIFAHNTFEGAIGESGHKLSGIPTDIFPKGSKVVSGDIHFPQTFGPITYCGSPYTVDFGEEFEPRVLLIKDDGSVQSVKCTGPQKRLIVLGSTKGGLKVVHDYKAKEGDIVKITVQLGPGDYARWPEIKQSAEMFARERGYVVHMTKPEAAPSTTRMKKQRTKTDTRSDEDLMKAYGSVRKIDDRTLKTGLDLL